MVDINEQAHVVPSSESIVAAPPKSISFVTIRQAIELALRLGDPSAAENGARYLLRMFPEAVAPMILLGQALLDLGDAPAAIAHFRLALSHNPCDAAAWIGLAGALSLDGQTGEADAALRCAALHDPLDSELLTPGVASPPPDGVGIVYLRRGYATLAAAELRATLESHPDRMDLRLYYAEALRRGADLSMAREQLVAATAMAPATLPALLLLAALAASSSESVTIRQQCARYDVDGQITRRFFAPDGPPWNIPPAPMLPWNSLLESLMAYISHATNGRKSISIGGQSVAAHQQDIDPDMRAFVATAEQVRSRISAISGGPRPLIPWNAATQQCQILLGCKTTLLRRYGEAGFAAIDRRLRLLAEALCRRGVQAYCCYVDDASSLQIGDQISLAPVVHDAVAIRELIRTLAEAFGRQRQELATLLLIGGDDSIPFHRLPNPLHDDDPDVFSDTPYGSDDAGYLLPHRVVARLPDGAGDDPGLLLTQLDQMLDQHRASAAHHKRSEFHLTLLGGQRSPARQAESTTDAGYCAEIWRESSRAVLDVLAPAAPLAASPPLDADTLNLAEWAGRRVLYMNLHGASGLPNWYGQPDLPWPGAATKLPVALRPDQLAAQHLAGGLLISEACYGAELVERTPNNSIPLRALAEGVLACVGATASSYGSNGTPLVAADLLCQRLLIQLASGIPAGPALHQARLEFAQTMYRRQGYLDDVDIKTLTQFVLLGDPWASIGPGLSAPTSWPVSKLAGIERVPKPRPKAVLNEHQVPRDLLKHVRAVLSQVLPGARTSSLYIVTQPTMRLARKNDSEQDFVFSAHDQQITSDGHTVAQTAHVTVSRQAIVKVALTH
ncbi:MAG TPA: tetratricopeptide repeat protein [Roseiflexaceae bacterium]|nr:tetratricopeptide repeat protein [Roseiflexaceae bacterium]